MSMSLITASLAALDFQICCFPVFYQAIPNHAFDLHTTPCGSVEVDVVPSYTVSSH
jgi:hypothetical protein